MSFAVALTNELFTYTLFTAADAQGYRKNSSMYGLFGFFANFLLKFLTFCGNFTKLTAYYLTFS